VNIVYGQFDLLDEDLKGIFDRRATFQANDNNTGEENINKIEHAIDMVEDTFSFTDARSGLPEYRCQILKNEIIEQKNSLANETVYQSHGVFVPEQVPCYQLEKNPGLKNKSYACLSKGEGDENFVLTPDDHAPIYLFILRSHPDIEVQVNAKEPNDLSSHITFEMQEKK